MTKFNRGFVTIAQNSGDVDYIKMAYALALSLKTSQTEYNRLSILITPGTTVPEKYKWAFDQIIEIPWGDHASNSIWKLENEWKVYHATPYDETIKLDADMLFPSSIDVWWNILSRKDFCVTTSVLNYREELITSDHYRKVFTANNLPNVYTALMYFKKSNLAHEVFDMAELIYYNWQFFFEKYLEPNTRPPYVSTDVVFALAIKLLDLENEITPTTTIPKFIHMKTQLQGWTSEYTNEKWNEYVDFSVTQDLKVRIGVFMPRYPIHYHLKDILEDRFIEYYEKKIQNI